VVEVERDPRAVLLGRAGELEAEAAGLGRQRGDQAGQVHDLHALAPEDPLEVEVLDVQRAADLAGAVVVDARPARAQAAVGQVELVAVPPGAALRDLRPRRPCGGRPGRP
jgi:hypothetical protein